MTVVDPGLDALSGGGQNTAGQAWWRRLTEAASRLGQRDHEGPVEDPTLRLFFVMVMFATAFGALSVCAAYSALFAERTKIVAEPASDRAPRLDLLDRNGEVLATDVPRWGLYIRPTEVADVAGTKAALLSVAPNLDMGQLDAALAGRDKAGRVRSADDIRRHPEKLYFVAGDLDPDLKTRLHDLALPGVAFQEEAGRYYPLGASAAHVVGVASRDGAGLAGAEAAFDKTLHAATPGGGVAGAAPAGARSQRLSLDMRVQGALSDEVRRAALAYDVCGAAGLVVNARTGEILAMASWPDFDPNLTTHGAANPVTRTRCPDPAAEKTKAYNPNMKNLVAAKVYEPGSIFKVFTLAMALDAGVVSERSTFRVDQPIVLPGQTIHDFDKGDHILTLREVFTHSSNIGAAQIGLQAGAERMERYFRSFGLFGAAPSELRESTHPVLPPNLSRNTVATMAFGHSISESPLNLATAMTAILNGGVYRPLTLQALEPGEAPAKGRPVIQESTSRRMLDLMRQNVLEGTGKSANIEGYRVGGKTGTAVKLVNGRYDKNHNLSSFAAVFPTDGSFDQDRYYVLVMLDDPHGAAGGAKTTGGLAAAPVVGQVIRRIGPVLGVPRQIEAAPAPPETASSKAGVRQ